jgi:hypothetical protein
MSVHLPNPARGKRHHVCDWIGAEYSKIPLAARRKRYVPQLKAAPDMTLPVKKRR